VKLTSQHFSNPEPVCRGLIMIIPSVSRAGEEIENMAFQAGQDYVAKFYPQVFQDTQQLYTGKIFNESNQYIFAKNWKKR